MQYNNAIEQFFVALIRCFSRPIWIPECVISLFCIAQSVLTGAKPSDKKRKSDQEVGIAGGSYLFKYSLGGTSEVNQGSLVQLFNRKIH